MAESPLYDDYRQITNQLAKVTADLHRIITEFNTIKPESVGGMIMAGNKPSTSPYIQRPTCTLSDWYLKPLHQQGVSNQEQLLEERNSPVWYKPGGLGALLSIIRNETDDPRLKNMEQELLRRRTLCNDGKSSHQKSLEPVLDYEEICTKPNYDTKDMVPSNWFDPYQQRSCQVDHDNQQMTLSIPKDPLTSPYYTKLAELRLEELHLEEELLLELKRQQELSRTRGPRKYWYMLRTREFTKELMKNTAMLKNLPYLDEIMQYRKQLFTASQDAKWHFQKPLF